MKYLTAVDNNQFLFDLRPADEGTWRIRLDDKEFWLFIYAYGRKYVDGLPFGWNPIETVLETCPTFNTILYHISLLGITFSKVEVYYSPGHQYK